MAASFNAISRTTKDHEAAEKKKAASFEEPKGTARRFNFKRTINNELTNISPYAVLDSEWSCRYHRNKEADPE